MYGCRVIQKVIELGDMDQKKLMALEMKDKYHDLIEDQNGNHVVQKIIETMGKEKDIINFVVNSFESDC